MESRQQALRTIALKLNVSGTAEVLDETKLYKGSYGFVKLQAYAPKTQNTQAPVCTVFCTTQNEFGVEQISDKNHNLLYVGEYTLDGQAYLLFESYLPKEFTSVATPKNGLKITLNYYDTEPTLDGSGKPVLDVNGVPERHTTNLLVSSRYITTVYPGGWNNVDVELGINLAEAAQINENMRNIAELQSDVMGIHNVLDNTIDGLDSEIERATDAESTLDRRIKLVENITLPPDCTEANNVGEARVVMKPNGGLKFIDIKGEKGDTGEFAIGTVKTVDYTERATVTNSGTTSDAVLDFEIPQGKPAFVKIGRVITLPPESEAQVINVGTDNKPILDIYIPAGIGFRADKTYPSIEAMNAGFATDGVRLYGFVVINTGNVEDDDNAKLFMKTETEYMFITDMSGIQGIQGEAATIDIDKNVDVLEADASPTVENIGSKNAAFLKFGLPKGATVSVDENVVTLDENDSARVENIGNEHAAVLKFYLPQGKKGETGDPANLDEMNARYYWAENPPPVATMEDNGTVKLGSDEVQTVAANDISNIIDRTYAVQFDSDGRMVVNIPWTDTHVAVDEALSIKSENPVQNKVIAEEMKKFIEKAGDEMTGPLTTPGLVGTNGSYEKGPLIPIRYITRQELGVESTDGTEVYLKAWLRQVCIEYPNISQGIFIGTGNPSSQILIIVNIYETYIKGDDGLPLYAVGFCMQYNSTPVPFGMRNGEWTFGNNQDIEIHKSSGTPNFKVQRDDTEASVSLSVGTGGANRGIYDNTPSVNQWLVYTNGTNTYVQCPSGGKVYLDGIEAYSSKNPPPAPTQYGVCSTSGATVAKTVTISNFQLVTGATIFVKFSNGNTASSPTLNVNSTGAKAIKEYGTTAIGVSVWMTGTVVGLVYDGTNWVVVSAKTTQNIKSYGAPDSTAAVTSTTTDYITEYYRAVDGASWYRVWKSGWKEMGGIIEGYTSGATIALPRPFYNSIATNDFYTVVASFIGTVEREKALSVHSKIYNSFKIAHSAGNNSGMGINWVAYGV